MSEAKDRASVAVASAFVAALGPLTFGFSMGYTSPVINQIIAAVPLTPAQQSLFQSLVTLGAMFGSIIAGKVSDTTGRRVALGFACLPFIAGYLVISFANTVAQLYIGRALTGLAVGFVSVIGNVYIVEVAPTRLRGSLGSMGQLAVTIGTFIAYVLGLGIDFRWLARVGAFIPAILFALLFFVPESPRWLVANGKMDAAMAALVRLRGPHYDCKGEIADIQSGLVTSSGSIRQYCTGGFLKPLFVAATLMVYQQFTGINAIIQNATQIFVDAEIPSPALSSALAVGGVQVLGTVMCALLMDRLGRRVLLIIGGIGTCIPAIILGAFFYLRQVKGELNLGGLAVTMLVIYILAYGFGSGAPPWVLMSELFSSRSRGLAASVVTLSNWASAFAVTGLFLSMQTAMSYAGLFWFYGGVCALGTLFVIVVVPETKGKRMEEIQRYFSKGAGHGDEYLSGASMIKEGAIPLLTPQ
eukprot:TRINITY_DN4554_c0_g1_i1.p2 TRINITY_DN4554_c0_g1~~TRINITY_DN4554_c0_g1_i1.p2  ORF type:complete len:493 (+),score=90.06 TRINITY_DN4554_c0_g1_i1:67-1479(+)